MVEAQSGSRPEARPKRTLWQVMLVRPMATSTTGHHRASANRHRHRKLYCSASPLPPLLYCCRPVAAAPPRRPAVPVRLLAHSSVSRRPPPSASRSLQPAPSPGRRRSEYCRRRGRPLLAAGGPDPRARGVDPPPARSDPSLYPVNRRRQLGVCHAFARSEPRDGAQ
ncbi:hypothetical protein OsI_33500 [Oryza sativa Indica Group]|uniref:Uncharacterized protein n=1 Tax=Oryza sativa subsp. indica TaxID=39946 RepID=B8BGQ7_ORYSI|nr:hypothetical protein OsI_33500 [Oryza sativa Indica Group]